MRQGKVFIFSAPSGSGKTTIVQYLLNKIPSLGFSISATTRPPRGPEEDGKDYYFMTKEEFEQHIKDRNLVEWEEVYPGVYYGTLKSEIERIWDEGKHVVFDVDVVGGMNLKRYFDKNALAIFIKVGSLEELRNRLVSRNTDSEKSIEERLKKATEEYRYADSFDIEIINDSLEDAYNKSEKAVKTFIDKPIVNPASL